MGLVDCANRVRQAVETRIATPLAAAYALLPGNGIVKIGVIAVVLSVAAVHINSIAAGAAACFVIALSVGLLLRTPATTVSTSSQVVDTRQESAPAGRVPAVLLEAANLDQLAEEIHSFLSIRPGGESRGDIKRKYKNLTLQIQQNVGDALQYEKSIVALHLQFYKDFRVVLRHQQHTVSPLPNFAGNLGGILGALKKLYQPEPNSPYSATWERALKLMQDSKINQDQLYQTLSDIFRGVYQARCVREETKEPMLSDEEVLDYCKAVVLIQQDIG